MGTKKQGIKTYATLFSGAGIGCYGFSQAGFKCIASVELLEKRIKYQRANKVCEFDNGYVCGDISNTEVLAKVKQTIQENMKSLGADKLDVLLATPPCQGMSVANHKKNNELPRNSLVIESIKLVNKFQPNYFIFENVPSFLKTICLDTDGTHKPIEEAIKRNLQKNYIIESRKINFSEFGSNSSRTRTLVIGINKSTGIKNVESLFPSMEPPKTLRQVIGHLPPLNWGEIHESDIYHAFRLYKPNMREWISGLREGQSAFENDNPSKRPHKIVDGLIIENKNANGDKYKRQLWDKTPPCIHTRNDILASQNTIHPVEDRVFSIRELMEMMTIPENFKFSENSLNELNQLTAQEKRDFLKKEELNIRHSIGEAVPTKIFNKIALNILKSSPPNNE